MLLLFAIPLFWHVLIILWNNRDLGGLQYSESFIGLGFSLGHSGSLHSTQMYTHKPANTHTHSQQYCPEEVRLNTI